MQQALREMGKILPVEKWAFMTAILWSIGMFFYALFLPLRIGTGWLTIGHLIYLVGFAMVMIASVNIAKTPVGQPFVNGIYRYSTHLMMFFSFVTFMGISLATTSGMFLFLSIVVFPLDSIRPPDEWAELFLEIFQLIRNERRGDLDAVISNQSGAAEKVWLNGFGINLPLVTKDWDLPPSWRWSPSLG
jgi:hypothetical protein